MDFYSNYRTRASYDRVDRFIYIYMSLTASVARPRTRMANIPGKVKQTTFAGQPTASVSRGDMHVSQSGVISSPAIKLARPAAALRPLLVTI